MANGCNLYFTENDLALVEKSVEHVHFHYFEKQAQTAVNILKGRLINDQEQFAKIISDPFDERKIIVDNLLKISFSNGQLWESDEQLLSDALSLLFQREKDVCQPFEKVHIPTNLFGDLSISQNQRDLDTQSLSRGASLMAISALIERKEVLTTTGKKMEIKSNDLIGFGQRLPSRYTNFNKNNNSLQANMLISRIKYDPPPPIPAVFEMTAIDTKYLEKGTIEKEYNRTDGLDVQLKGVRDAFDAKLINDFCFTSNVPFGKEFSNKVRDFNFSVLCDHIRGNTNVLSEYPGIVNSKQGFFETLLDPSVMDNDKKQTYLEIIQKYEIPQVGMCGSLTFNANDKGIGN